MAHCLLFSGTIYAGMGCTHLNKLLSSLNIPRINSDLYKKYESDVGAAIEIFANETCKESVALERKLTVDNLEKIEGLL